MRRIKKNSVQRMIGFEGFTKYGVRTEKAEFGGEPPLVIVAFCTSCKRQPTFCKSVLC